MLTKKNQYYKFLVIKSEGIVKFGRLTSMNWDFPKNQ
ncbi:hypothetical protein LCGC14_0119330 [marine sediment metagenome]|uniref:Uncharacterized protein n=1 Tax=marine sediment metagenome TaxID=412755 RepID=A0A0F9VBF8_9ZZZZ